MKGLTFSLVTIFLNVARGLVYYPKQLNMEMFSLPEHCDFAVDAAFLVDVTYSQYDKEASVKSGVMKVADYLHNRGPENRFGLATFTDKPIPPLGYNGIDNEKRKVMTDYCFDLRSNFDDTRDHLEEKVVSLGFGGGWDFAEAQLEAMMRAVKGTGFEWRNTSLIGRSYIKALFVVTDSMAHTSPEAANAAKALQLTTPIVPNALDVNSSLIATDLNAECGTMEYPTLKQVGDVLREEGIVPVFLISPAAYTCTSETGLCPYPEFEHLAEKTGNSDYLDPIKGMDLLYKSYLEEMNIPGIVQHLGLGFENFFDKFVDALVDMKRIARYCGPSTTTMPYTTKSTRTALSTKSVSTATTTIYTETSDCPCEETSDCPCEETSDCPCEAKDINIKVKVKVNHANGFKRKLNVNHANGFQRFMKIVRRKFY